MRRQPGHSALLLSLLLAGSPIVEAAQATSEERRAAHALNRLAFGARPGEVQRVAAMGVNRWIAQQLQPERIPDESMERRLEQYATLRLSDAEMVAKYYQPLLAMRRAARREEGEADQAALRQLRREGQQVIFELTAQRILRASESERQLNEVMLDFWMNHFNVFAGKGIDRFLLTGYERDTIRPNLWGRFEDLLLATAKSPAMLWYLDNARSVAAPENRRVMRNQQRGGLNENYARELLELHTLGVDGGYTQKDVTELARLLTGWSIARPEEGSGFVFRRALHDQGAKTVLRVKFPAGGGMEEGERMIRLLAHHPSTARHIAFKLSQRLVADQPPASLVDRVARRFSETRGDLRETVRAVVTSPEFWDPKYERIKVKSPFEYAISAVRAVGAVVENPLPIARELQKLGEPLYFAQPPTGYSDASAVWVNSGALMNRLNFALDLAANKMRGVRVTLPGDVYSLAGVPLSEQTMKSIREREGSDRALLAGLVLGSPEFQRQ